MRFELSFVVSPQPCSARTLGRGHQAKPTRRPHSKTRTPSNFLLPSRLFFRMNKFPGWWVKLFVLTSLS
jgi:hypothetical protein